MTHIVPNGKLRGKLLAGPLWCERPRCGITEQRKKCSLTSPKFAIVLTAHSIFHMQNSNTNHAFYQRQGISMVIEFACYGISLFALVLQRTYLARSLPADSLLSNRNERLRPWRLFTVNR
jgi:hypothetical protein